MSVGKAQYNYRESSEGYHIVAFRKAVPRCASGCAGCHNGVNVGGEAYYPFGVVERPGSEILPLDDKGRFEVTQTAADEYVFRAVPLRNVALTVPYFHSGKVWDLDQAVGVMGSAQLGQELSQDQIGDIAAFLKSLTGEMPEVRIPNLPPSTDDTPRPISAVRGNQGHLE